MSQPIPFLIKIYFEEYSWSKFSNPEHGEWFGYLNRRGEVLLQLKGGKWKGCFHVPRAMYQVGQTFEIPVDKPVQLRAEKK